jgi:hypothetical protein
MEIRVYKNVQAALVLTTINVIIISAPVSASLLDGLVTYYPFDGDANDLSGNGNDGAVVGATLTADRFGVADSAYSFDGVNDYIVASADVLPTAERTVAFWFNADSLISRPIILGYGGGSCGTSWYMGVNVSGLGTYHLSSHCNVNTLNSPPYQEEPIGEWKHFAITTSVAGTTMFVDGTEIASNTNFVTNTNVAGRDLAIGVATSPSGFAPYTDVNVGYFDGAIDDVRIYNRALSANEVEQLATIPIPSALWLFGSGILWLAGIARKK